MPLLRSLFSFCAPLALFTVATAQGHIVVAHDEWTLSSRGFNAAPASTAQFVRSIADWFTGGLPGSLRVRSSDFRLVGSQPTRTMARSAHAWTLSTSGTFDLATLQQYDAVFLGVSPTTIDTTSLSQDVQGGGGV